MVKKPRRKVHIYTSTLGKPRSLTSNRFPEPDEYGLRCTDKEAESPSRIIIATLLIKLLLLEFSAAAHG